MKRLLAVLIVGMSASAFAQVDEIKRLSSSVRSGDRGGSGGSGIFADIFFNIVFGQVIQRQQNMLAQRDQVPTMVSVELQLQTAIQPASYYIVQPRIRGNWGLFSTDYRINYLIQEDIDGFEHIRTNDWQVVQFNFVHTRDCIVRAGGGFLQEGFSGDKAFGEFTMAFQLQRPNARFGGVAEYRGAAVRREVNGALHYKLFETNTLHGYITGGAVYQRYYESVTAWGLQGGLLVRAY